MKTATQNGKATAIDLDEYREQLKEALPGIIKAGLPLTVCYGKNPGDIDKAMGLKWQQQQLSEDDAANLIDNKANDLPAIGVMLGPGGAVDFDIDGADEKAAFNELFDGDPPILPQYTSGREGGEHRFAKFDDRLLATEAATVTFTFKTADGKKSITVRIGCNPQKGSGKPSGAQSIVPPSWHVEKELDEKTGKPKKPAIFRFSGKRYKSVEGCDLGELGLPELPDSVIAKLLAAAARKSGGGRGGAGGAGGDACEKALQTILRMKAKPEENDASTRLLACACRCVEHDLSDKEAIAIVRKYEVKEPFPQNYSDDEILVRVLSAEKKVERGSALSGDCLKDHGAIRTIADTICQNDHFAIDSGGRLFRYRGGCYRSKGEAYIKQEVKRLAIKLDITKKWSKRFSEEVLEFIRVDAPELWEQPPGDVVNVKNGLLRLTDGVLMPHEPSHLSPIQIPVKYDAEAECPHISKFIKQVFPADAMALAYEIPALLMTPMLSVQKSVLLLGSGGNGKSTYLQMVTSFIGRKNTSAVTLQRLERDRFAPGRLLGKLANIAADLPTEHLTGTSVFKSITGGDEIEGEFKFMGSFLFRPFARLIFSANDPPRSSDGSEGFFDRWVVVPFEGRFRGTEHEIGRQELDAMLSTPEELSGLLNFAVEGWRRIQSAGRLNEPASVQEAWREFHATTDPFSVWLDHFTVDDPDAIVPISVLRSAYGGACERKGKAAPTKSAFGSALRDARPDVFDKQRTVNGRVQWCYVGICLANEEFSTSRT